MKKFRAFFTAFCVISAVVCFSAVSEAAVKITVKNNRDHGLSLAFRWSGFDMPDDRRSGWYAVPSGESKTFTFKDVVYYLTVQDIGYYATGGGKVWAGKSSDERPLGVIIHPKNKFGGHPDDPIDGGKKVYFRHISLKQTDKARENGSATITFNP
jgi:hypothetical protein